MSLLAAAVSALFVGCANQEALNSWRVRQMSPVDRLAYTQKQIIVERDRKVAEAERILHVFLAEKTAELQSTPHDLRGLQRFHSIAFESEKRIQSLQYEKRQDYFSPQMRQFILDFRSMRDQQLQTLRLPLTADSGGTVPQQNGVQWLIYSGLFSDAAHPVFSEAVAVQRKIHARRVAELQGQREAKAKEAVQAFVGFLALVAVAQEKKAQDLRDRGLCPECEGKGKNVSSTNNKCSTCWGSGAAPTRSGLCPICYGLGTIGIATPVVEDCRRCDGTGKYGH
ncbi:MAG TPA: hypothetical protein VEH04_03635 [Verrucomicrobiae bacterium]|nr:hypothetical protein [Verrucomicrobiae bacterium]